MGSSLSHFWENVYMDRVEKEFEKSPLQPRGLMRYLDDYIALWSHGEGSLDEFLNFINQLDARIEFTIAVEEDKRLPFLDFEVIRANGVCKRRLFRKNKPQLPI
ncbi:unnamed protein product [Protopolystoma xenopodis]|uniref:Reverse transcriptase domain-containing protein n=1 Tax=Protopolystoma xenopodis TaxID=117903 RepID=A0A3S5B2A4_9PLAT|nr:unnamed protein product [Protopolystoma xenopodis]